MVVSRRMSPVEHRLRLIEILRRLVDMLCLGQGNQGKANSRPTIFLDTSSSERVDHN